MPRKKSEELGKREKDILAFIEKQIKENGYPPSVREIGKSVGLSSTATVHGYLTKLEQKGYIKKENQKGRTLRLLKGTKNSNENKPEVKEEPKPKKEEYIVENIVKVLEENIEYLIKVKNKFHYLGYFEDERAIGIKIEYLKLQNNTLKKYIPIKNDKDNAN